TIHAMDLEELFPSKPDDPLVALGKQDLDPISIAERHERIEALKAEIARVEAHIQRVQTQRAAAEELFQKRYQYFGECAIRALDWAARAYDIASEARRHCRARSLKG